MTKLAIGDKAPNFTLPSSTGKDFTLSDALGKWVVLYFYPKDDTPGCTKEACNFRDRSAEYSKANALIYGVSMDDLKSHLKFIEKYQLPFPLLSDSKKEVVESYGVMKEKSMFGKSFLGLVRTTFVINPQGEVSKVFSNVKVENHHKEVLEHILSNQK